MLALANSAERPQGLDAVSWLSDWIRENAVNKVSRVTVPEVGADIPLSSPTRTKRSSVLKT